MTNFIIGDFISNLNIAKHQYFNSVYVKNSKIVLNLLDIMLNLGLIRDITYLDDKVLEVFLKYYKRRCVFHKISLISVPSKRVTINLIKLVKLKNKYGNNVIFILSTNKGLKTDFECITNKISGEVLLKIEL